MPDIANTECFEAWNGDSGRRWAAEADRRDRVLAPVAEALLAPRAAVGADVLDIGCGCGSTTLATARTVGLEGPCMRDRLLGPDARHRASASRRRRAEQRRVRTSRCADARVRAEGRRGDQPFRDDVLRRSRRRIREHPGALRPHGRLCLATWQPLAANDWLTIPGAALLRYGTIPESVTGGPGMFGQSNSDAVTTTLTAAGYHNVTLRRRP